MMQLQFYVSRLSCIPLASCNSIVRAYHHLSSVVGGPDEADATIA